MKHNWINKIIDNVISPLNWAFIIAMIAEILTTINTKGLILIVLVTLVVIFIIKLIIKRHTTNTEENDKCLTVLRILECVLFFLTTFQTTVIFVNRYPYEVTSSTDEIAIVKEYYEELSTNIYYNTNYQTSVPQDMDSMETIVLLEFGNPEVTIKYINNPGWNIAGCVPIWDKSTIYINKPPKDEILNNTITLTHELCHVKGIINEAYTEFMTCKTLLNSSNNYLRYIGCRYAIYFLSGGDTTYYNCTQLLVNDYLTNIGG